MVSVRRIDYRNEENRARMRQRVCLHVILEQMIHRFHSSFNIQFVPITFFGQPVASVPPVLYRDFSSPLFSRGRGLWIEISWYSTCLLFYSICLTWNSSFLGLEFFLASSAHNGRRYARRLWTTWFRYVIPNNLPIHILVQTIFAISFWRSKK